MAFGRKKRDLRKGHLILGRKKPRVTITDDGIISPERRRLAPGAGGTLGERGWVEGSAEELFENLGRRVRGIGTKSRAKRKKKGARRDSASTPRNLPGLHRRMQRIGKWKPPKK
jgi:hypothetical protein